MVLLLASLRVGLVFSGHTLHGKETLDAPNVALVNISRCRARPDASNAKRGGTPT